MQFGEGCTRVCRCKVGLNAGRLGQLQPLIKCDVALLTPFLAPHKVTIVYRERYIALCICVVIISFSSFNRKITCYSAVQGGGSGRRPVPT
jgi:hypothetical protein